jgi:Protein of unknown function (DUF1214)
VVGHRPLAVHGIQPGVGSAYTCEYRDTNGDGIDAARTYRLHLPGPIPAKDFWSVVVYDLWTRSMLANGQAHPGLSTYSPGVVTNDDGSVDIYIGPEPPPGKQANWIRTLPDTGWAPSSASTAHSNHGSKAPGNPTTSKHSISAASDNVRRVGRQAVSDSSVLGGV